MELDDLGYIKSTIELMLEQIERSNEQVANMYMNSMALLDNAISITENIHKKKPLEERKE